MAPKKVSCKNPDLYHGHSRVGEGVKDEGVFCDGNCAEFWLQNRRFPYSSHGKPLVFWRHSKVFRFLVIVLLDPPLLKSATNSSTPPHHSSNFFLPSVRISMCILPFSTAIDGNYQGAFQDKIISQILRQRLQ